MSHIENEKFVENHYQAFEEALDRKDRATATYHLNLLRSHADVSELEARLYPTQSSVAALNW